MSYATDDAARAAVKVLDKLAAILDGEKKIKVTAFGDSKTIEVVDRTR